MDNSRQDVHLEAFGINGMTASGVFGLQAERAVLLDVQTATILWARNPKARGPVASIQKLLAALLILSSGDLDHPVTAEPSDRNIRPELKAAELGLQPGRSYRRGDLLEAMLIGSANDAALALARDQSGSPPAFAAAMTALAGKLGMSDSHFLNPHGLPADGQYSTAQDIAALALAADAEPRIRGIVAKRRTTVAMGTGETVSLTNTNRLLGALEGCDGMKTGYTRASGACVVASAETRYGRRIAIVLNSTLPAVWDDARMLLAGTEPLP